MMYLDIGDIGFIRHTGDSHRQGKPRGSGQARPLQRQGVVCPNVAPVIAKGNGLAYIKRGT